MAIYRGAGGAGDATNDAASEVLLAIAAKDAAIAAQVAAEVAQAAAEAAQTAAETAETNAETAETNAETAETNAETAETNAETAATNAASSASAASTSASNASTSATNASNSASAASTSASNAATSATNASNSASSASTSATNASNSASAAATSATNAANSATAAQTAQTAAELAETNAETAETNAETAETNAAASASAASTSASNAASSASAASTSASNAATSATNASNSASSASTSATNASNSASAAATSASNAATSESNAATSASNAAASYDSFDDRYLGAKSSAPTLDNDGNTLLTGALYFNTVTNEMKVWSGSAWLNAYASLSGALLASNNLSDLNNTATARTNLGVAIGTDVQAWDGDLDAIAAISGTSGLLKKTAANTWSLDTNTYLTSAVTSVTGTSPVSSSGGTTPAISLASGYGDTQNPYASKTANFFLAAPNGSTGVPTFRAIVAADVPTLNQNTTGTASNVTGIVAISNGGTGSTTSTGSGAVVLATSPTITSPDIAGTPTGVGIFTLGTSVASTSGTSIDFTGIPSWVKRITVMFNGVSTNGTSQPMFQLGDAGGIETTGYTTVSISVSTGANAATAYTNGWQLYSANAANTIQGNIVFSLITGNTWSGNGQFASSVPAVLWTSGTKSLSDTLTTVRITTAGGTDTFDAGTINILYE